MEVIRWGNWGVGFFFFVLKFRDLGILFVRWVLVFWFGMEVGCVICLGFFSFCGFIFGSYIYFFVMVFVLVFLVCVVGIFLLLFER